MAIKYQEEGMKYPIFKDIPYGGKIDNYTFHAIQKGNGLYPDTELFNAEKHGFTVARQTLERIIREENKC